MLLQVELQCTRSAQGVTERRLASMPPHTSDVEPAHQVVTATLPSLAYPLLFQGLFRSDSLRGMCVR